ncbi:hypothetical protein PIB30_097376, partial [Stylosanthes scabra]|nr:hypothetical protein [Stylosanthes scabra]
RDDTSPIPQESNADPTKEMENENTTDGPSDPGPSTKSVRIRKQPGWMKDYEM